MSFFSSGTDAIALLKADHRTVDDLFRQFEKAENSAQKIAIVNEICKELTIHARIEEEIFYPQVFAALGDDDDKLVREAVVEHGSLKGLMSLLNGNGTSEEMFDAYVKVLTEYTKHHVKEEENELFPKVRRTDLDLDKIGEQLQARKEQLQAEAAAGRKPSRSEVTVPEFARAA
jgi:hemerythrin superfamily protein